MKVCRGCNVSKDLSDFHKDKECKYGVKNKCKSCVKKRMIKYRLENKDKIKTYSKKYYNENKEALKEKSQNFRDENRELVREYFRKHKKKNRNRYNAYNSIYRAAKNNATIDGYSEEIKEIYKNCPNGFEVDHIHPLNHPNVCGLHIPSNLQYLTSEENKLKGNKFDGTVENNSWKLEHHE